MSIEENPPEDHTEIADKIRSGEYFREARDMYDFFVHDPMAERYIYVLITALAALILLVTELAMQALYPLNSSVPFIFSTNNIAEDIPRIKSLISKKGENPSDALLRFMVDNYVTFREEYDIDTFDRDINGVKAESSNEVFKDFQQYIDPHNPESPIALYERHSRRRITILSNKRLKDDAGMEVIFEATVTSKTDVKTRWQANIAFNYSGIVFDDKSDKVKPVSFIVTKYQIKRIQDLQ